VADECLTNMKLKLKSKAAFYILYIGCVVFGASIWIASSYFTGEREPWNSMAYYTACLLLGGFVAGLLHPQRFWRWAIAIWLGQIVGFFWGMHTLARVAPFAPLGFILFLPMYSLWSLFGAFLGGEVRLLRKQPSASPSSPPSPPL